MEILRKRQKDETKAGKNLSKPCVLSTHKKATREYV